MNKNVISALIGLVGAISNNGKSESTDSVIRSALLNCTDDEIKKIHQEKFKISPDCASCKSPCGNTSDYPVELMDKWPTEQRNLKEQIMAEIIRIAKNTDSDSELPEIILKAIAYIGYDLEDDAYIKLLEEMYSFH